ncbi:BspA family leucine-rich repeat surface protein, partial [Cyclobacteriaceae bacterium]|nr:BspA family leucine-rich repeat surface protein [Cyclobacteriaceae bacterium]
LMIYLDENGITIKASKEAIIGEEYELNGQKYKVVDEETLREMVENEEDVTKVVTSRVTDMSEMFAGAKSFNKNIGSWDVSKVSDMNWMFSDASAFNQNIGSWNVSKVTDMSYMFMSAQYFNQDIGSWDVSKVKKMESMFEDAESFNQDIGSWNLSKVSNMERRFFEDASLDEKYNPLTRNKIAEKKNLLPNDKKIIPKIKKLLGLRDYAKIDTGVELLRSLNQANLYENLLLECSIDKTGKLNRNSFFLAKSGSAQPYLDYALISLIAYAPKDATVHESLKVSNVKNLILETDHEANTNSYLPLENFKNLRKLILDKYENIKDLDFLSKNKNLEKIDLSSCKKLQNLDGLKNCVNLEKIDLSSCKKLQNLDGLINCVNLKEINIELFQLPRINDITELKKFLKQP